MIETYIPLYRKYRPQSFADVVGQEPIVKTLGNAINLGKVAHAYLFCGPRGTGKTSTARIFAKSLNCEAGPTVSPCQTCASCTGITGGNALDVVEFDAASNNGVEDARELIENVQFTAMAGKYKIYIIDEVHMLSNAAFNTLLKTLEEPPPNVVFIFATTEAHKVLPTIISRCQRFDFTRIKTGDIAERLRHIAGQEDVSIEDEALSMIARHARGGMRDAIGQLDQVAVLGRGESGKTITCQDVALFIGALEEDVLLEMAEAIADRDTETLLARLRALTDRGVEPGQLVREMTRHFRSLLMVKATGEPSAGEALDLPQVYFEKLQQQVTAFETEELPQILARLSGIERNIRHTQQPWLWLEVGLLELAFREDIHRVSDLARRVEELEARLANGSQAPASAPKPAVSRAAQPARPKPAEATPSEVAPEPVAESAKPEPLTGPITEQPEPSASSGPLAPASPASAGGLDELYRAILQKVASPPVKALLNQWVYPIALADDALELGCTSEPIAEKVSKPDRLFHLQKAAEAQLGRPMKVRIRYTTDKVVGGPVPDPALQPEAKITPPRPEPDPVPEPEPQLEPELEPESSADRVMVGPGGLREEEEAGAGPDGSGEASPDADEAERPLPVSAARPQPANQAELDDARQYSVELLQGRILD